MAPGRPWRGEEEVEMGFGTGRLGLVWLLLADWVERAVVVAEAPPVLLEGLLGAVEELGAGVVLAVEVVDVEDVTVAEVEETSDVEVVVAVAGAPLGLGWLALVGAAEVLGAEEVVAITGFGSGAAWWGGFPLVLAALALV